jgi:hypothetical protein
MYRVPLNSMTQYSMPFKIDPSFGGLSPFLMRLIAMLLHGGHRLSTCCHWGTNTNYIYSCWNLSTDLEFHVHFCSLQLPGGYLFQLSVDMLL